MAKAEIVDFQERCGGCFRCINLMRIDKGTFVCTERTYTDGSSIYPIVDGKHSEDWGACNGEGYERVTKQRHKKGASNE